MALSALIGKLERAEVAMGLTPAERAAQALLDAEMDAMIEDAIAEVAEMLASGMTESDIIAQFREGRTGEDARLTADITRELVRLAGGAVTSNDD